MSAFVSSAITRRSLLVGVASATVAASRPKVAKSSGSTREFRLVATPARWPLVGEPHPDTDVWCLTLQLGRSYVLTVRNDTSFWHPVHFHGHSFRVLSRNGSPVPHRQWADTVLLPSRQTAEVAFVADNPGDWMLHCHITDHQVSGLMTVLRVA